MGRILGGGNLLKNKKVASQPRTCPMCSARCNRTGCSHGMAGACAIQSMQGDAFNAVTNDAT